MVDTVSVILCRPLSAMETNIRYMRGLQGQPENCVLAQSRLNAKRSRYFDGSSIAKMTLDFAATCSSFSGWLCIRFTVHRLTDDFLIHGISDQGQNTISCPQTGMPQCLHFFFPSADAIAPGIHP